MRYRAGDTLCCVPMLVGKHVLRGRWPLQKEELVGEDAAYFDVEQQSTGKWVFFTVELAVVLGIMYVVSHINTASSPALPGFL